MIDSNTLKEQIRQRTDLVELVAEHVALRRSGRYMVGLCPFHDDRKTPSFKVDPSLGIYKCFTCNAGGDVFTFVQTREGVSFVEAMRILADRAGIDIDVAVGRKARGGVDRAALARVNAWAADKFRRACAADSGQVAREYMAGRNISEEIIARFALGWAPREPQWLLAEARRDGVDQSLLVAAGLAHGEADRDAYAVFRGRLMFPIRDTMNRVIGFGGRTLIDDRAKYLNTSQNALFDKGRNVYGIDLARPTMMTSRRVIVCEGYTDCIACHQHGFADTVATLGTALTDDQINLLRRWCDEIILFFDSDEAGIRAANRALGVALRHDLSVRVARVEGAKDPCEFLETRGATEFEKLLNSAVDALVFKWHRTRDRFKSDSGAGRKEAIREFVTLVAEMVRFRTVDAIQKGLIVNQLSTLLSLPARDVHELLAREVKAVHRPGPTPLAPRSDGADKVPADDSGRGEWEAEQAALRSVLMVLVNEPAQLEHVAAVFHPERLRGSGERRIAERLVARCEQKLGCGVGELMSDLEDPEDARLLTDLVEEGRQLGDFDATIADIRRRLESFEPLRDGRAAAEDLRRGTGSSEADEVERLTRIQQSLAGAHGFAPGVPVSSPQDAIAK